MVPLIIQPFHSLTGNPKSLEVFVSPWEHPCTHPFPKSLQNHQISLCSQNSVECLQISCGTPDDHAGPFLRYPTLLGLNMIFGWPKNHLMSAQAFVSPWKHLSISPTQINIQNSSEFPTLSTQICRNSSCTLSFVVQICRNSGHTLYRFARTPTALSHLLYRFARTPAALSQLLYRFAGTPATLCTDFLELPLHPLICCTDLQELQPHSVQICRNSGYTLSLVVQICRNSSCTLSAVV